jgi:MYXO-CTERM domain-containing protein
MTRRSLVVGVGAVALMGCGQRAPESSTDDGQLGRVQLAAAPATVWDKQARLTSVDELSGDLLGYDMALDGSRVALSAHGKLLVGERAGAGAVYVFDRSGLTWSQQKIALDDPSTHWFGTGVALSGDTLLAMSANYGTTLGKGHVFVRTGNSWASQAELVPSASYAGSDQFGMDSALDGDTAIVGAHGEQGWAGGAWVFERSGASWGAGTRLAPQDPAAYDYFGQAVSLNGDTAVIGAPGKGGGAGAAYVFVRNGATWEEQAKLEASDAATSDNFGVSVSIDGDSVIVGASYRASEAGAAYVFVRSGTTWTAQQKLLASDSAEDRRFGHAVDIKDDRVIIGARQADYITGDAYIFARTSTTWSEQQKLSGATVDPSYAWGFGQAVAIDGDFALVAADRSFAGTGAVYSFRYALAQGSDCETGSECHSGFCVDGVCCNVACQGQCSACVQTLTGSPDGECAALPAGQDPEAECEVDPGYPNSCGADGLCDGAGQCREYAEPGVACGAAACSAGALIDPKCDGAGQCDSEPESCTPYVCDDTGAACSSSCSSDDACDDASYCADGICRPAGGTSDACDSANQCASGFCVDGVCCDSACNGQCEACGEPGQRGSCRAVSGAPRGARQACASTAVECAGSCDGSKRDACSYPDQATSCSQACAEGVATTSNCDGQGACVEGPSIDCSPYSCGNETCRTTCLDDDDCAEGFECQRRACVAPDGSTPEAERPPTSPSQESSGCNCRHSGSSGDPHGGLVGFALAAVLLARRRTAINAESRRHRGVAY